MFFIGFALGDADRSDPQRTNLGYYLLPFFFLLCGGLFGELDSTFRPFPCLSYAEAQPIFAARKGREKKAKNITFAPLFRKRYPEIPSGAKTDASCIVQSIRKKRKSVDFHCKNSKK